jgi:hypothetical protein
MNSAAADSPQERQVDTSARQGPSSLWLLTALALAITLAIPFFLVDVPPVLDYPNHLARYPCWRIRAIPCWRRCTFHVGG